MEFASDCITCGKEMDGASKSKEEKANNKLHKL
jgi:hypothetical protein